MPSNNALNQFVEEILSISAPAQNIFGGGIPGMLGASAGANQASLTPAAEVVKNLKQQTLSLRKSLLQGVDTRKLTESVEGNLLALATFEVITQQEADNLIDNLHTATM